MRKNIIVEGVDASGKSTLVKYLADKLGMRVQLGEGPPKHRGEIDERIRRMASLTDTIFDRHPVVSQSIYCSLREGSDHPRQDLVDGFYRDEPYFIYCRGKSLHGHVVKDDEDADHVAAVNKNFTKLLRAYDKWALRYAHIIYRIGDPMPRIVSAAAVR